MRADAAVLNQAPGNRSREPRGRRHLGFLRGLGLRGQLRLWRLGLHAFGPRQNKTPQGLKWLVNGCKSSRGSGTLILTTERWVLSPIATFAARLPLKIKRSHKDRYRRHFGGWGGGFMQVLKLASITQRVKLISGSTHVGCGFQSCSRMAQTSLDRPVPEASVSVAGQTSDFIRAWP